MVSALTLSHQAELTEGEADTLESLRDKRADRTK